MSIWRSLGGFLTGGWKTYGPNQIIGPGAFNDPMGDALPAVNAATAARLSAVLACVNLRSESIGSLPLHLRDKHKNIVHDHPLYDLLHRSPNALQTAAEFWSMTNTHVDFYGNSFSKVNRTSKGGVISLEPFDDPTAMQLVESRTGWRYQYQDDPVTIDPRDILHFKGFSTNRFMGLSRLEMGRQIIAAQLQANTTALETYKNAIKVSGFIEMDHNLTVEDSEEWERALARYRLPENRGKFLTLFKGMKATSAKDFQVATADIELLSGRGFGIEEICRLFNVPPQLIGHSDKSSSWASSIENINLFYLIYSLTPSLVRQEQRLEKTLLSGYDRAAGIEAKWSVQGLMRANIAQRQAFYASGLQNGYMSINEVRDLEERSDIEGGDAHRVQLNLTDITGAANENPPPKPTV